MLRHEGGEERIKPFTEKGGTDLELNLRRQNQASDSKFKYQSWTSRTKSDKFWAERRVQAADIMHKPSIHMSQFRQIFNF